MRSAIIGALLVAVCLLACFRGTTAECCIESARLLYRILGEDCEAAGGTWHRDDECMIHICANGQPKVDTFCGHGPCNIFGCNCDGGCLSGDWIESFRKRFSEYSIEVIYEFPQFSTPIISFG